ncbi:hypothetical protein [Endozoicomonas numazuensis]|uniref:Uncharacterized protein n=1 Tax=Endozoicomonas numazuensis TaxID=1137799 RepID=A0A081NIX8_9GAMM|nr:hypothetical protein [Endozoicomonas numazuensis]KEQ18401.1 hypothetical protein GZ78_12935 [Endozoicomonas numazuensis]
MSAVTRAIKTFARTHFTVDGLKKDWASFRGMLVKKRKGTTPIFEHKHALTRSRKEKNILDRQAHEREPNQYVSFRLDEKRKPNIQLKPKSIETTVNPLSIEEVELRATKALNECIHAMCVGDAGHRIHKLSEVMRYVHMICLEKTGNAYGTEDIGHTLEDLLNRIALNQGVANVLARELSSTEGAMQDLFAVQLVAYYKRDFSPKMRLTDLSLSNALSHTANECMVMTPVLVRLLAEKVAPDRADEITRQFACMKDPNPERLGPVFNAMLRIP